MQLLFRHEIVKLHTLEIVVSCIKAYYVSLYTAGTLITSHRELDVILLGDLRCDVAVDLSRWWCVQPTTRSRAGGMFGLRANYISVIAYYAYFLD